MRSPFGQWVLTAAVAATAVVAASAVITVGVCGVYHDDAVYVSTAKALATGQGYRLINIPGSPPQTRYPILYPLALSAIWRIRPVFPDNLAALQWLTVAIGALAIAASHLYAIRVQRCHPVAAAFALAICATSPALVYFNTLTLSEMPFLLTFVVALWVVAAESGRSDATRAHTFAAGILLAFPALVRTVGLAIVAPMLYGLRHRHGRVMWLGLGAAIPLVVWTVWAWSAHEANPEVGRNYVNYLTWWGEAGRRATGRVLAFNALMTATATADWLPQSWKAGGPAALWPLIGVVIWIVVALRARASLTSSLVAYVAVVLVWPWPSFRFIVPMWPLLLPVVWDELRERFGLAVVVVASAILIGGNIVDLHHVSRDNQTTGYPAAPGQRVDVRWHSFERVFSWIRENSAANDTLTAGLDTMLFLYTGRPSIRAFAARPTALFYGDRSDAPVGGVDDFIDLLQRYRPRYLVQTPLPGFAEERPFNALLERVRADRPSCLDPVFNDPADTRFAVFAINIGRCRTP
jgi:hypothetical protein